MESNSARASLLSGAPWYIWLMLALHFVLAALYSVAIPAWEAVDEPGHYRYVEYVALNKRLPPAGETLVPRVGGSEGTQPPLYYILAAIPVALVNPPAQDDFRLNRYATAGSAEYGVNMVVHDFAAEAFPWRGQLLALHLARFVSVVLGTIGVWYVFLLARWLLPDQPALFATATAIAAFAPQFLFLGSTITNDLLIAVLGCAALYYASRLALDAPRAGDLIGLGVSLGLAFLTKNTAVGLLPSAGVALGVAGWRAWRQGQGRRVLVGGLAWLALVGLLAGWWIGRNLRAYGAPLSRDLDTIELFLTGLSDPAAFFAGIPWDAIPGALWYGFQTFWGTFGWVNVGMPSAYYHVIAILSGIALLSCLVLTVHPRTPRRVRGMLLFLAFSVAVLALLPFAREVVRGTPNISGRFLFPTLPAVGLLSAIGLLWPWPALGRKLLAGALAAAWLACAALTPFLIIEPAYARPPAPASQELPPDAEPLQVRFADRAELYGYRIWPTTVPRGKNVGVTLWFKALRRNVENYAIAVYVFGPQGQPYGQVIRFPGRGNFATSLWKPGDLIEDVFWVPINADAPAPIMGRIGVSMMLDGNPPVRLGARDGKDRPLGEAAIFGRFKISDPQATPVPLQPAVAIFDDKISLVAVQWPQEPIRPGDRITVTARLQARRDLDADYVLFVHLRNLAANRLAGVDAVPRAGEYPPGLWDRGEGSIEERALQVPPSTIPGQYELALGIYRADNGERLRLSIGGSIVTTETLWFSPRFIISNK